VNVKKLSRVGTPHFSDGKWQFGNINSSANDIINTSLLNAIHVALQYRPSFSKVWMLEA
jgi:hypothetical protein